MKYRKLAGDPEIRAYYERGNQILGVLGYTDHSEVHAKVVAEHAMYILETLEYPKHTVELAGIAGYLHDIGNAINRSHHAEYGALLARDILRRTGMELEDQVTVVSAIANHDESTGTAFDPVSSALILADKTDVRRNRVRTKDRAQFDIHDRVNYAVVGHKLVCSKEKKSISINLEIDETICSLIDYFEIFLGRMMMCRRAAEVLDIKFRMKVNGQRVL
jgi:metal-dependent HD superfamily phosphatase/phosphodiesterase